MRMTCFYCLDFYCLALSVMMNLYFFLSDRSKCYSLQELDYNTLGLGQYVFLN